MSRLLEKLKSGFLLMVSPPSNEPAFALAAQEEGAHALKVHINMINPASLRRFGNWQEEKNNLLYLLERLEIPLGIVPGAENLPGPKELEEIARSGFDFWDLFLSYLPVSFLNLPHMGKMVAIPSDYRVEELRKLKTLGINALEASIFHQKEYRKPLLVRDLLNYRTIVEESSLPVLVSTQRKIEPSELSRLKEIGVSGIVIGAVVTGTELEGFRKAVREFREAIEQLK